MKVKEYLEKYQEMKIHNENLANAYLREVFDVVGDKCSLKYLQDLFIKANLEYLYKQNEIDFMINYLNKDYKIQTQNLITIDIRLLMHDNKKVFNARKKLKMYLENLTTKEMNDILEMYM